MAGIQLDHVGVVARQLDAAQAAFRRLGFSLTSRSMHSGEVSPGGPVEPWASGNHCAMFAQGYLEVLGEARTTGFSGVRHLVERYEGAHMVVFSGGRVADLEALLRLRGVAVQAPRYLERGAAFGERLEAMRTARFWNLYVPATEFAHATVIFIEHLTPEVLWQEHLLEHPNGVVALGEVGFVSEDAVRTANEVGRLLGIAPEVSEPGTHRVRMDRTDVHVMDLARWHTLMPEASRLPWPAPAWIGFRVRSIEVADHFFRAAGICTRSVAESIWVLPEEACGVALRFSAEAAA